MAHPPTKCNKCREQIKIARSESGAIFPVPHKCQIVDLKETNNK